nr:immunoglobulin heavy chain junction region [Macaca mulatta]MOW24169.1 immunoglobulin heavy chain junction region [Macaca mulatta]MOW25524.1 immunoglobulin heavy chain junction region [Macaca mulatta]
CAKEIVGTTPHW